MIPPSSVCRGEGSPSVQRFTPTTMVSLRSIRFSRSALESTSRDFM